MRLVRLQWGLALLLAIGCFGFAPWAHAQPVNISQKVGVCDPKFAANCIKPNSDGSVNISGASGGASFTAASGGTIPVVAGANKPGAIDLFSSLSVQIKDALGVGLDWTTPVAVGGQVASGATVSGNPLQNGGRASTAVPTPVTDGQAVAQRLSKLGNTVTSAWAPRDLQGDNGGYTATATTSAVDCVTAGASGLFRDIVSITVNNSSATDTVVQILDTDGTTVRWTGTAKANDMRGISFPQPLKEVGAAASWKCKTVTSVSSVVFTIQYFETK